MDAPLANRFPLFADLLRSRATPLRSTAVGRDGTWLVHWHNADTETVYSHPGHHTLSCYLRGGHGVRCVQAPEARGEPGVMCSIPPEHESKWYVRGSLELLHVYLPRLSLEQAAERWFDLDPRAAELVDRVLFHDAQLASSCARLAAEDWTHPDAPLRLQHLVLEVQARLLTQHAERRRAPLPTLRGGLSPAARRRVLEWIETALSEGGASLDLADLAQIACLSEFHFARMFKASFGMSPHVWIMQRRLHRARALLHEGRLSFEAVAHRCGYAHLQHLNAALRRAGFGSASRYRASVGARRA
ncbi:helix-turn-helix domain-containing protein [Pendulispora albinea]|uniref:Helix-turn-helix transcriptional regulator n=1 Tax=Pendulispora albinea TaxID=2741071 RepID=A0ABZ2M8Z8_9BACT